jgi:di/tricarboxylate transporter
MVTSTLEPDVALGGFSEPTIWLIVAAGGYVALAEWWRTGLIAAGANIVIWMGVGAVWLKVLGHW